MIPGAYIDAAQALWNTWWRALLGAAIVFAPAFLLGQCSGQRSAAAKYSAARAIANVETIKADGASKEIAANERRVDDALVSEHKKDLTDAVAALPDAMPSARRVALACQRLRQQGTDTASLSACR